MNMNERRRLPRKYLVIYSRVMDRSSGRVIGYLSDMSIGGMMLIGELAFEVGALMHLRLDLPETMLTRDHIDLDARVAWSKQDIDPAFYNTGFEFNDLPQQDEQIINQVIELYEFRRDVSKYPPAVSSLDDGL